MFPAYLGFEDLSLRVEVQWQDRTRPVVARLEQWPDSSKAVLVCVFEGEDDESLIRGMLGFYFRRKPRRSLQRSVSYDDAQPRTSWRWSSRAQRQLRAVIEKAFHRYPMGLQPNRAFYLAAIPGSPQIIVDSKTSYELCSSGSGNDFTPFLLDDRLTSLDKKSRVATTQLTQLWTDKNSSLRFAWEWAQLSEKQRQRVVTGFDGDLSELAVIMSGVLNSSSLLWRQSALWYWCIHVNPARDRIYAHAATRQETLCAESLAEWNSFLRAYFLPNSCRFPMHPCARDHIITAGEIHVRQPPTAHEQLEAKLALRDWLAEVATPAVAARLLASLDG